MNSCAPITSACAAAAGAGARAAAAKVETAAGSVSPPQAASSSGPLKHTNQALRLRPRRGDFEYIFAAPVLDAYRRCGRIAHSVGRSLDVSANHSRCNCEGVLRRCYALALNDAQNHRGHLPLLSSSEVRCCLGLRAACGYAATAAGSFWAVGCAAVVRARPTFARCVCPARSSALSGSLGASPSTRSMNAFGCRLAAGASDGRGWRSAAVSVSPRVSLAGQ